MSDHDVDLTFRPASVDEFLEWEGRQELRYEFDGVRITERAGVTIAHSTIQGNLTAWLVPRLRGGGCHYFGSILKLRLRNGVRYPDAMVVCAPVDGRATFVTEPTVVFEVLSKETALTDTGVKNDEYSMIPSVLRYVMLEQDRIGAIIFTREAGGWLGRRIVGPDAVLHLPEIGVEALKLSDLYDGLDMDAHNPGDSVLDIN